jgi:branched-chain amino acid transport system ATP-binding protein
VTLLGRNGAGKTRPLKSVMGIVEKRTGSVTFEGKETVASRRCDRAPGAGLLPEERGIFSEPECRGEPDAAADGAAGRHEPQRDLPALPQPPGRVGSQGTKLSGGEQQMLAIGRILRTGANLLLLDEPTEGLAPVIVQRIGEIIRQLKGRGFTILLVEQNFHFAATVADRHYIMEDGHVVDIMTAADVKQNIGKLQAYLGV